MKSFYYRSLLIGDLNKMNFIIAEHYLLGVFYLDSKVCSNVEVDDRFLEEFSLGHIKDLKGSV